MPGGIRLFLAYALLILAGIGLSLRSVVDMAISAPVSLEGVVVMVLLAYTIFTTTLVLQRKEAARGLALGLASLTIPLVPLLALSRLIVEAIFIAALGLLLFRGLLRPEVRAIRVPGSIAWSLTALATGRLDGVLQVRGLQAVDVAAAGLIAREAGARVTAADGGPWIDIADPSTGRGIAAGRPAVHRLLVSFG